MALRLSALFALLVLLLQWVAGPELTQTLQTWQLMGLSLLAVLSGVWALGTVFRNHSLMDIAYPLAPWLVTMFAWWSLGADPSAALLLIAMGLWAWRLAGYLAVRYLPYGEEARYAKWRARGGASWWWRSYFQIYLTQGVIVWVWCLPLAFALQVRTDPGIWGWLAAAAWLVGQLFEVGGDWQMHRFRRDPSRKGQVMDTGLWAWCRHPNYFGEAMTWLAWGMLALAAPMGWLGLPAVVFVFWFMNRGSALSMTERYMLKTKPGYADYMARTPAFFPRPPRANP
jgi:steroid 5-alpha reductase family enzyme